MRENLWETTCFHTYMAHISFILRQKKGTELSWHACLWGSAASPTCNWSLPVIISCGISHFNHWLKGNVFLHFLWHGIKNRQLNNSNWMCLFHFEQALFFLESNHFFTGQNNLTHTSDNCGEEAGAVYKLHRFACVQMCRLEENMSHKCKILCLNLGLNSLKY